MRLHDSSTDPLGLADRVRLARLGGGVERCHIIPHIGSYNNAAHSWGVAMLMLQLWPEDFPRLAAYCICHDVPEAWVGDIPAHTKQRLPALGAALQELEDEVFTRLQLPSENELVGEDRLKLKACDALELYLWALEEIDQSNRHASEIVVKLESWFDNAEHRALPQEAFMLYKNLRKRNHTAGKADVLKGY